MKNKMDLASSITISDELGIRLKNTRNIISLCSKQELQNDIDAIIKNIIDYKEENGNLYFPLSFEKVQFENGDFIFRNPDENTKTVLKDICETDSIRSRVRIIDSDMDVDWENGEVPLVVGLVLMSLTLRYPDCISNINGIKEDFEFTDQDMLKFRKVITATSLDYIALERLCPRLNVLQKVATNITNVTLDDIVERESGPVFTLESDGDLVTLDENEPRKRTKLQRRGK